MCTLLTSAEQATLAVAPGQPKDGQTDVDKGCVWRSADKGEFLIQINAYGELGHKDVVSTGEVKTLPNIGKHRAVQFSMDPVCAVSLGITESARVDATVTTGHNLQEACPIAMRVAQMIEPKVPSDS
ncbi:Protein of unknown function [Kibdelosporangium aridum]|uniref:DUF3558 domain-containing protein n=1 Tax=Kibdelosporangium aridum TaxID=2030 RepID=A0A1W2FQ96_KIBAR|nr:Protein of unknown function [Kibdelosporangium aridum]